MNDRDAMRNQPKRKNHFTPVLYLRNFCDGNDVLHVVSPIDGHRWKSSPAGIGYERGLYWPDNLEKSVDPNKCEDTFCNFEGAAAPVINEIVTRRRMPTDDEQLGMLFNFIAFQAVRGPNARRTIAAPREDTARIIMDLLVSSRELYENQMRRFGHSPDEYPYEKIIQGRYEPYLTTEGFLDGAMKMMDTILRYLHRRSWTVLYSDRSGEQFVVSDHPVALTWSDGHHTRVGPGHAHLKTDVTFPLSSSVALLGRYEAFEPVTEVPREIVATVNSKTINHAQRFVAGCSGEFVLMRDSNIVVTAEQFIADLKTKRQR